MAFEAAVDEVGDTSWGVKSAAQRNGREGLADWVEGAAELVAGGGKALEVLVVEVGGDGGESWVVS